jgi:hypothetical protein
MNLNENITRIKQVMGIITENKPVDKLIEKMGVKGAIQFAGGMKSFNSIGGMDYLFDKVDELLKDYTNLIIVDDMEDKGGGDKGTWKTVAYGEKNNEKPTEPPYVYFNWSKNPMNNPKASLEFDKVLSEKLTSLNIPENLTKIILEKWIRKYYDNIPPISTVRFGDTLGYNQGFSKPDPNFKPNNNKIYMPKDEEGNNGISKEEIIKLLKDVAKKTPKEEYMVGWDDIDNFVEWSNVIFSQVEYKLESEGIDTDGLRKDYDYVLIDMWRPGFIPPYKENMGIANDYLRDSDREERERLNR